MKKLIVPLIAVSGVALLAFAQPGGQAQESPVPPEWQEVWNILGGQPMAKPNDTFSITLTRHDIHNRINADAVSPELAYTDDFEFKGLGGTQAMTWAELTVTELELPAVLDAAQRNGFEVSAVHNHWTLESKRMMFVHMAARGNRVDLAHRIFDVLRATNTLAGVPELPQPNPPEGVDVATLERLLGGQPTFGKETVSFDFNPSFQVTEMGIEVTETVENMVSFQPIGGGLLMTAGELVTTADRVNAVVRTLRASKLQVMALHNHRLREEPRLFFIHFWGEGTASQLGTTLSAALSEAGAQR
jgi:hypothetical protein